jgi:LacI family transcriptional regulator
MDRNMGRIQKSPRAQQGGATIADVARASGFSPMTVSRVINGERNVKDSTRDAVMEAVEKLNYSPNLAARTLAGAEQIRIAMLYGNPSFAYLSRLLVGTLEQARKSHVQLVIEQCDEGQDIHDVFADLIESGVDGVVLSPPLCDSPKMLELIQNTDVTCVVVANWCPPGKMSVVYIDDVEAAATMTRHCEGKSRAEGQPPTVERFRNGDGGSRDADRSRISRGWSVYLPIRSGRGG